MLYANYYGLEPGDTIVEPIFILGMAKHFAMYLGVDDKGVEWITENKKFKGVQIIIAADYFKNVSSIARIEKFNGNNAQRRVVVENAFRRAGKPYDLTSYNCEHYVNEITRGRPTSRQVEVASIGAFALFLLFLFKSE